ncbi:MULTISPECIES: hypothetical protein [Thermomonospora]|uniref:Uncharacterized protein n=1 Tax=Thermomonospora curvata (strain ATCC 19995 / DSM 43183 / JCM 3096 / KCTC 9072 / NBRC 15933 / NCIMB 10081 / Henssen B9) TaxID=471852 RepID=D1ABK1_THECD|nr:MULTISPECIES: hypothetical protein [Thermomonospora]ACY97237.1 hypothetical protein Tcur_1661 [Thermomonospora curvata DSM 43183]PKK14608.1 MAG: hypothetical protein BUE48_008150 [Thermomonospora sp. CIF 1]
MSDAHEAEARAMRVLSALLREAVRVAWPEVRPALRDAIPRLEVAGPGGSVVDVRVDEDGERLVFRPSLRRHSADDIPGAVAVLLALARQRGNAAAPPSGHGDGTGGQGAGVPL